MKKKTVKCLLLFAFASILLCGCQMTQSRSLRIGVKDDVANFGLYDAESGRYSGMEIDLAKQLSEDLGYSQPELISVSATTREEMLDNEELDMVIATYSITDERKENYDFSTPYYTDYTAVMVEKSSMIARMSELKGCRIGVMRNSSSALFLVEYMSRERLISSSKGHEFVPSEYKGGLTFVEYDSYDEISNALEWGEVDAFVADRSILSGYIRDDRRLLPDMFSKQDYGVCMKKGSSLSEKVDEAVQKRLEDGTINGLIERWGN